MISVHGYEQDIVSLFLLLSYMYCVNKYTIYKTLPHKATKILVHNVGHWAECISLSASSCRVADVFFPF